MRLSPLSRCWCGHTLPSRLVVGICGRAESSSVTRCARKDVVLGEAFAGISLAPRRPDHPEVCRVWVCMV